MKKRASHAASNRIASVDVGNRTLLFYIGISLLLHIVLMTVFIIMPALTPSRRYIPSAVNVSLVSIPALGNGAAKAPAPEKPVVESTVPEKPAVTKEPVVKPVPVKPPPPPPKPEAEVSTAPTPKPETKKKESLKHKTFKPSEVIKDAVSKMEKKVEETRPSKLEETLNRLKQQVEKEDRSRKTETGASPGQAGSMVGSPTGSRSLFGPISKPGPGLSGRNRLSSSKELGLFRTDERRPDRPRGNFGIQNQTKRRNQRHLVRSKIRERLSG